MGRGDNCGLSVAVSLFASGAVSACPPNAEFALKLGSSACVFGICRYDSLNTPTPPLRLPHSVRLSSDLFNTYYKCAIKLRAAGTNSQLTRLETIKRDISIWKTLTGFSPEVQLRKVPAGLKVLQQFKEQNARAREREIERDIERNTERKRETMVRTACFYYQIRMGLSLTQFQPEVSPTRMHNLR